VLGLVGPDEMKHGIIFVHYVCLYIFVFISVFDGV
jgi:hypothetical protein